MRATFAYYKNIWAAQHGHAYRLRTVTEVLTLVWYIREELQNTTTLLSEKSGLKGSERDQQPAQSQAQSDAQSRS